MGRFADGLRRLGFCGLRERVFEGPLSALWGAAYPWAGIFRIFGITGIGFEVDSAELEGFSAEVDEEAGRAVGGSEVAADLSSVGLMEVVGGLELDYEGVANQQVDSVLPHSDSVVEDRDLGLTLERNPLASQLHGQGVLVDGLQESSAQRPVHRHRSPDHRSTQPLPLKVTHSIPHVAGQERIPRIPRISEIPVPVPDNPPHPATPTPTPPESVSLTPGIPLRMPHTASPGLQAQAGFTLLEVMMALLLLATAIMILVQSQATAVHLQDEATRINTATMLARSVFTELEFRMFDEGFGELEVKESGDFSDAIYNDQFDDYRWEYEVEKVEVELPGLGNLMSLLGAGQDEAADAVGLGGVQGQQPGGDLAALSALGILQPDMLTEQLSNYLREARVRICWTPGRGNRNQEVEEECLEVISHLSNPTGRVLSAEEQEQLNQLEDTMGTEAAEQAIDAANAGGGGRR